jgi:ParB family chromosome partitioning protein
MKIKEFAGFLNPVFHDTSSSGAESAITLMEEKIQYHLIAIDKIFPRVNQPRKMFDDNSLLELAESIRFKGIIQPIIIKKNENDFYEIIAGERRWRAAKKIGLNEIPAIIKSFSKSDETVVALIENIQRENLNPLEMAYAIQSLQEEYGLTHQEIAENLGIPRSSVSNLVRLLNLEQDVKEIVSLGLLELGHAKVLLALSGNEQVKAANLIVEKKMTVRESEKLVRSILNPIEKQEFILGPKLEEKIRNWEKILSNKLSSKVNFHFGKEGQGRVVIHFDSVDEAGWLMEKLSLEKKNEN